MPNRRGGVSGFGMAQSSRRQTPDNNRDNQRHNWGRGHNLGGD